MGKRFRFRDFLFKIRFQTFSINFYQKILPKIFDFAFFHYLGHFDQKMTESQEKSFTRKKFIDFEIFGLK